MKFLTILFLAIWESGKHVSFGFTSARRQVLVNAPRCGYLFGMPVKSISIPSQFA